MTDEHNHPPGPGQDQPLDADVAGDAHGGRASQGHEWLAQLQQMIDRVAHEAAPVARDVAAKAAELAAVAGEKAGPLARRAAEATEGVGTRVAERSRRLAEDLRSRPAEAPPADAGDGEAGEREAGSGPPTEA